MQEKKKFAESTDKKYTKVLKKCITIKNIIIAFSLADTAVNWPDLARSRPLKP